MTSREPGQCPGIWDSVIHKDMVTDETGLEDKKEIIQEKKEEKKLVKQPKR